MVREREFTIFVDVDFYDFNFVAAFFGELR